MAITRTMISFSLKLIPFLWYHFTIANASGYDKFGDSQISPPIMSMIIYQLYAIYQLKKKNWLYE